MGTRMLRGGPTNALACLAAECSRHPCPYFTRKAEPSNRYAREGPELKRGPVGPQRRTWASSTAFLRPFQAALGTCRHRPLAECPLCAQRRSFPRSQLLAPNRARPRDWDSRALVGAGTAEVPEIPLAISSSGNQINHSHEDVAKTDNRPVSTSHSAASGNISICSWRTTPESGSKSPIQGLRSSTALVWR
jgi:hypothetical protein